MWYLPLRGSRTETTVDRIAYDGTDRTWTPARHQEPAAPQVAPGLTVLGVVFGVAAVISMLAVGEGASRDAQERIEQLGATNIIIRSVKPSEEALGGRQTFILNYGLKYKDYERILATVPTIKRALPIREIRRQIRHLDRFLDGRVVGTTHDYAEFNRLEMARGRFLTKDDNDKIQNYAVLAAETAEMVFPYQEPINNSISSGPTTTK